MASLSRKALDEWLPTLVRYLGFVTAVYGVFVDRLHNPAVIPAAVGLMLFKTIYGTGERE